MPYSAPGLGDSDVDWILGQVNQAQSTLDAQIAEAMSLPDSDLSKIDRITRLNQMKREVDSVYLNLDGQVATWADQDLRGMYMRGHATASTQLGAGYSFTLPHQEAIDILVQDAYDDIGTRLQQIRSAFGANVDLQKMYEGLDPSQITAIQEKTRASIAQMLLTGEDPRKVSKALAQDLWSNGIPIIDSSGRHWNPETYTRMLIRTKSANAYNAGAMNKYAEEGVERVRVFDGTEDDEDCAEANGEIWSLRYAMNHVIEHPNCRRAFAPEQGKGPTDKDTLAKYLVVFDRASLAIGGIRSLRAFRNTGELNVSSTLARLVLEMGESAFGVGLPGLSSFLSGVMGAGFKNLDTWVESYIDPVLYQAGLIKAIPRRAVLARELKPIPFLDQIMSTVVDTKTALFIGAKEHQVDRVIDVLEDLVTAAGQGLAEATEGSTSFQYVEWIAKNLVSSGRYGEITGEFLLQMPNKAAYESWTDVWVNSAEYVNEMRKIKALHQAALLADQDEAQEIYRQIVELRNQLRAIVADMGIEGRLTPRPPISQELFETFSFWAKVRYANEKLPITYARLAALDHELEAAQLRAFARIQETRALAKARDAALEFPVAAGDDFVKYTSQMWDEAGYQEDLVAFQKVMDQAFTSGTQTLVPDYNVTLYHNLGKMTSDAVNDDDILDLMISAIEAGEKRDLEDVLNAVFSSFKGSEAYAEMVADGIIDSAGKLLDGRAAIKKMAEWLELIEFDGSRVLWDGLDLDIEINIRLALSSIVLRNAYLFGDLLQNTSARLPGLFDPLLEIALGRHDEMHFAWVGVMREIEAAAGQIDKVRPVTFATLGRFLEQAFPGVQAISSGIHGHKYVVAMPSGRSLFIKTMDLPQGVQLLGDSKGTSAQMLHSWMGEAMGGVESVQSSIWTAGDDMWGVVMPYLDDARTLANATDIDPVSARKLGLLDILSNDLDGHSGNFMKHQPTGAVITVDRETGFFQDTDMVWRRNLILDDLLSRSNSAWIRSGDYTDITNTPGVKMIALTKEEVDYLISLAPHQVPKVFGKYPMGLYDSLPVPLLMDVNGDGFLVAGRVGTFKATVPSQANIFGHTQQVDTILHRPTFFLTQEELDFVLQSVEDRRVEIRRVLADRLAPLPLARKAIMQNEMGVKTWDEFLDKMSADAAQGIETRINRYIEAGVINITGGVEEMVTQGGVSVKIGTIIDVTDASGNPVKGAVIDIIETKDGNIYAKIAPDIGQGHTSKFLTANTNPQMRMINVDDLQPVQVREATFPERMQQRLDDLFPEFDADEKSVYLYEATDDGLLRRSARKKIQISLPSQGDTAFNIRSQKGFLHQEGIDDILGKKLTDEIWEAMKGIPADERPLSIRIHAKPIVMKDGRKVFGYYDTASREAHISVTSLFPDLRPDEKGRLIFDSISDLQDQMDFAAFRRVVAHELGHGTAVGKELRTRAISSRNLWQQLLDENEELTSHEEFVALARQKLREANLPHDGDNPIRDLINFRLGVIEDITNSQQVDAAKKLIKNSRVKSLVPPEVVEAIKRGDPDAHHELLAELNELEVKQRSLLTQSLAASGKVTDEDRVIQIGNSMGFDEKEMVALKRLMIYDTSIPTDWDTGSTAFVSWFNERLTDVQDLVPLARSKLKKFWKEVGLDSSYLQRQGREGGFTYDIVTTKEPPVGWAVAIRENEEIIYDFDQLSDDEFRLALETYAAKHQPTLSQDGWFFGGWHDVENNRFVMDTTRVERDEISAAHFAFKERQDAIFNLSNFQTKPVVTKYATIDEYIDAEVPEAKKLKNLLVDVLTSKNKSRKSIVDELDRPPPVSLKSYDATTQKKILNDLSQRKVVTAEAVGDGRSSKLVPAVDGEELDASPAAIKDRLTKVLEAAEEDYGWVSNRIFDNDEWASGHKMAVRVGSKVKVSAVDDMWEDLREAVRILQENDIKFRGAFDDLEVVFLDNASMRRYGTGGASPSVAVRGNTLYVNSAWSKSTVAGSRVESIIREMSRFIDPDGTKARSLQDRLAEAGFKMADLVPDSTSTDVDDLWADIFQRAMTGDLDPKAAKIVRGIPEPTLRARDRFYQRWRNEFLIASTENNVEFRRIVAAAAAISPGMDAEAFNLPMALYMTRMIAKDAPLTGKQIDIIQGYLRAAADQYRGYGKFNSASEFDAWADSLKTGMRLSDMESMLATRTLGALAASEGEPWSVPWAWDFIERGVLSLRGEVELVDIVVETKVRSFFNNIIDPLNVVGVSDVTVDFHMLDAAFFGNTRGGSQSFGVKPSVDGLSIGLRVTIADVIRELYDEGWGLRLGANSPAELQEILWGTWRAGKETERWGTLPLILDIAR